MSNFIKFKEATELSCKEKAKEKRRQKTIGLKQFKKHNGKLVS